MDLAVLFSISGRNWIAKQVVIYVGFAYFATDLQWTVSYA